MSKQISKRNCIRKLLAASLAFSSIGLMLSSATIAQTEPATSLSIPEGPLKVKITGITGIVQYRATSDEKWQKAAEGVELTEGAELRTGPRSAVRFMIGDDQTVSLDRLGTIQILRANFVNGKVFTDLGMKYGRTRYDIESAAREHDAKVRSPSSVLAVRGTQFSLIDQPPFAPEAISLTGRVVFRDVHKEVAIGKKGGKPASIDTNSDSAAAKAVNATIVYPTGQFSGVSDLVAQLAAQFGGSLPNPVVAQAVATTFAQARMDSSLMGRNVSPIVFVQEQLFFGLNWTGEANSDVDLQVIDPTGAIVDKAHPTLPGFASYQDAPPANATGTGGTKAVTYLSIFPAGKYTINLTLATPTLPVTATVDAIKDPTGQANDFTILSPGGQPFSFALDAAHPTASATVTAVPAPVPPPALPVQPQSLHQNHALSVTASGAGSAMYGPRVPSHNRVR